MNKINVPLFLDLLRKSSCNYSIENVKMSFTKDTYRVGLRGQNSLIILSGDNDIISNIAENDEWVFTFSNVQKNIKAYFDLLITDDNDEVVIVMKENKIILKTETNQKIDLYMCIDRLVDTYEYDAPKTDGDIVYSNQVTDDFINTYSIIKKIAASFNKIYFTVKDKELFIEATDKTNSITNGITMKIGDTDYDDITVPFEFKTFNNIMTLLNGDSELFVFRIGYVKDINGGIVSFVKTEDNVEKYYQLSIREEV